MAKKAIIPPAMKALYEGWRLSPGLQCDSFIFFSGFNGMPLDGRLSAAPSEQIEAAFAQVDMILREGGLSFSDVVEMTSYHVGLRDHLEQFKSIRARYVREPYPAWTAIEVVGFASEGVIVELRIIARKPQ
jgi:enamine deaminase RidA (YjgF/YER057c/UK114 family)